jgi:hypothetical protein
LAEGTSQQYSAGILTEALIISFGSLPTTSTVATVELTGMSPPLLPLLTVLEGKSQIPFASDSGLGVTLITSDGSLAEGTSRQSSAGILTEALIISFCSLPTTSTVATVELTGMSSSLRQLLMVLEGKSQTPFASDSGLGVTPITSDRGLAEGTS